LQAKVENRRIPKGAITNMFAEVNELVCYVNFCGNPGCMGKEEPIDVQG